MRNYFKLTPIILIFSMEGKSPEGKQGTKEGKEK